MRPELVVSKEPPSPSPKPFLHIKPETESSFFQNFENDLNVDLTSLQGKIRLMKN